MLYDDVPSLERDAKESDADYAEERGFLFFTTDDLRGKSHRRTFDGGMNKHGRCSGDFSRILRAERLKSLLHNTAPKELT